MSSKIIAGTTSGTALNMSADTSGQLEIQTGSGPTTAITVDASQNVGIGTSSPTGSLQINKSNTAVGTVYLNGATTSADFMRVKNTGGDAILGVESSAGASIVTGSSAYASVLYTTNATPLQFGTNSAIRATIDSSGNLLVGQSAGVGSEKLGIKQAISDWCINAVNTNSTQYLGIRVNSTTTKNDTSNLLYDGLDNGTLRFRVYANGGIANYSGNNFNLSDQREKKDIELSANYLDKICAISVKTFNYIDQTDDVKNIGVIAQEVQKVAPELVAETDWSADGDGSKMRLSVYQTDLTFALMKAIQELNAKVDAQAAEIATLKGITS